MKIMKKITYIEEINTFICSKFDFAEEKKECRFSFYG